MTSLENLGSTMKVDCEGPDCYIADPHTHQHWIIWPDTEDLARHTDTGE